MLAAINRPGVWLRAAMDGKICGLDLAAALVSLPSDCDPDFARVLLIAAETAFIVAALKDKDFVNG